MENLMQELKGLYNKPDDRTIKHISDQLKAAAKGKESTLSMHNVDSFVCEYFRKLGFKVDTNWDKNLDCQVAVFSGWACDDT